MGFMNTIKLKKAYFTMLEKNYPALNMKLYPLFLFYHHRDDVRIRID